MSAQTPSRIIFVLMSLTAVSLAGCADSGDDPADDASFDEFDVEVDDKSGVILGVVFDDAIRPVEDVTLTINVDDEVREQTSNAQGEFVFSKVPAGTHTIDAAKPGYFPVQSQVDVAAGVVNPKVHKIKLEENPDAQPYEQVHQFNGYIDCSVSTPLYGVAVCSVGPLADHTQDNFLKVHNIDKDAMFIQSEMHWQSTQAAGDQMTLLLERSANNGRAGQASGTSPLVIKVDEETRKENNITTSITMRVFNEQRPETEPPVPICGVPDPIFGGTTCLHGVGATVQQDFEVTTVTFYNYVPPEGWLFSEDGIPDA